MVISLGIIHQMQRTDIDGWELPSEDLMVKMTDTMNCTIWQCEAKIVPLDFLVLTVSVGRNASPLS